MDAAPPPVTAIAVSCPVLAEPPLLPGPPHASHSCVAQSLFRVQDHLLVRYGLNVPIFGEYADVRLLARLAVETEEAGWDGFWIWDHVHWSGEEDGEPRQPAVDTTVALTMIAAATSRVRFGPMVLPLARRRPWKVARELTTLDHLSGGRLTVGVGLGSPPVWSSEASAKRPMPLSGGPVGRRSGCLGRAVDRPALLP